jgi:hypothetical protein
MALIWSSGCSLSQASFFSFSMSDVLNDSVARRWRMARGPRRTRAETAACRTMK